MVAPKGPKRTRSAAKLDEETRSALEQASAETEGGLHQAKAEEYARLNAEEALAEVQVALAAQAAVEQERQARLKAEQTLAEARLAPGVEAENTDLFLTAPGEEGGERRFSFIVRLTVDERSQPRRTEVEHHPSGQKDAFPGLDVERLSTFMQACISRLAFPEPAIPPVPSPAPVEAPTPQPLGPAASLTISEVGVFRTGVPNLMVLTLNVAEDFLVQIRFQLQGSEAPLLTAQASSYEMHVYTSEVTTGLSKLLTSYRGKLVGDVSEYTTQIEAPGLSPGLYRLITLVTLQEPVKMIGHYKGPIIQVVGVEQPTPGLLASQI